MSNSLLKDKEATEVMTELKAIDNENGWDLAPQIEGVFDSFENGINVWGEETKKKFIETAPYLTNNLKESIDTDINLPSSLFVGVDLNKLLGPKVRTAVRGNYAGQKVEIPGYDYTEEANEHNVSSNGGVGGPFIEEVWFAFAEAELRRIFN